MGARTDMTRAQSIQQKRKAEAPFYRQLHQWLVQARHKAACVQHERALLGLQEQFLAGHLSQAELQLKVRQIVSSGSGAALSDDSGREREKENSIKPRYWHHSTSADGQWELFSGVHKAFAELLFRKQFKSSSRVSPTFRYVVECRTEWAASVFHFSLLKRFISDPSGITMENPVLAWDHLVNVKLTYAPADKLVLPRWDSIHETVTLAQSKDHMKLLTAVTMLQNLFRHGTIRPPAEPNQDEIKAARKKKKKRSKKKGPQSLLEEEHQINIAGSEGEAKEEPISPSNEGNRTSAQSDKISRVFENSDTTSHILESGTCTEENEKRSETNCELYQRRLATLSGEIHDLVRRIDYTMGKKVQHQNQVIWRVQNAVQLVFPCARVHLFGSHASGFALPSSDIDLYYIHQPGVCFNSAHHKDHHQYYPSSECRMFKMSVNEQLHNIQNGLREMPWVKSSSLIKTAAMPIIRISACLMALNGEAEDTHLQSRDHLCPLCFVVDLSCGHSPGHSNLVLSDLLCQQSKTFPELRPLMLVLKQILVEHRLGNVFTGGLSSFSLSLLVLRYLQHLRQFPMLHQSKDHKSTGPFPTFSPGKNGRFVDLTKDAEAQQELVKAYKRVLARWPRQDSTSGYAYLLPVNNSIASGSSVDVPLKEGATVLYGPSSNAMYDSAINKSNSQDGGETMEVDPEAVQQFAAYHRQLADWPTGDAAHHFHWMKTSWMANAGGLKSGIEGESMNNANYNDSATDEMDQEACDSTVSSSEDEGSESVVVDSIGEKLLGFLDFYGNHFNPTNVGVTVIGEGAFYLLSKGSFQRPPQPITIDNPCWPNLNVAASSYAISAVLQTWKEMHETLQGILTMEDEDPDQFEPAVLRKVMKAKWGTKSKALLARALRT